MASVSFSAPVGSCGKDTMAVAWSGPSVGDAPAPDASGCRGRAAGRVGSDDGCAPHGTTVKTEMPSGASIKTVGRLRHTDGGHTDPRPDAADLGRSGIVWLPDTSVQQDSGANATVISVAGSPRVSADHVRNTCRRASAAIRPTARVFRFMDAAGGSPHPGKATAVPGCAETWGHKDIDSKAGAIPADGFFRVAVVACRICRHNPRSCPRAFSGSDSNGRANLHGFVPKGGRLFQPSREPARIGGHPVCPLTYSYR